MSADLHTIEAAEALQRELAPRVIRDDAFGPVRRVAGVDVAYALDDSMLVAAAVVVDAETLAPLESVSAMAAPAFPYVPGLFSFRELPPILAALDRLAAPPDLIVCDGHGLAHPRRFGLASHLGVVRDVPTIGCAKTLLIGLHDAPASERGARAPLVDGDEIIGAALRTQTGIRPVYVSTGHRVSLDTACDWVLRLATRYRLPETTRLADQAVRRAMAEG